ncbi:protein wntless homolog isoform X2 [Gavia stellata]|uniref:protein wntless homolog isoform X2 n=1 Tax=Gavia stellata TaxID=37040 RepID=UPI0028A12B8D|nr:protein wntless homolog isoform X2 [Gavia stellata]
MAGAIIENMSTKKLCIVGGILLAFQVIAFLVGGLIEENAEITLDVSLAYRDDMFDDWEEIAHAIEIRKLKCTFGSPKTLESEGRHYDCDFLPFMEIGSVAHKFYLINIRLPVNERKGINVGIGEIKDIRLVGIHQNGGFTKVWFAMKTFLTPSILIIMVWYWRRITLMTRAPVLLEKVIFALGISMTFINIPVEWFSIGFDWTWMLLFGDIRQGIFYAMLLSFWIIFCGEHMMDQNERNRLSGYWKQVGPIAVGSFCLFIFDMCERGVQLKNPFYSIWTTEVGTELAMAFIIVAGICLCLYFLFLCFMVFQVFRNISGKQSSLPAMSKARRLHYEGLIFRFKFLMLITLACAAMTVIFFIVSQVTEGHWKWGDITIQVNSAFFTGIYGMWNLYVFALMFLYAPSHKNYGEDQSNGDLGVNSGEELQLTTTITHVDGPTEVYKLARKEAQE